MKYLPNQPPRTARLGHAHVALLTEALEHYKPTLTATAPAKLKTLRLIVNSLPDHTPYTVSFYAHEWEIVSRALRPQGSNPTSGTWQARAYALYQRLRKHMVFMTQGDTDRMARAAVRRRAKAYHSP